MSDHLISAMVSIVTAIIGIAVISVIVSKNAQTGSVISSAGGALAQDIGAAVSPVTGGTVGNTLSGFTGQGGANIPVLF